jgi:hypothetical protein
VRIERVALEDHGDIAVLRLQVIDHPVANDDPSTRNRFEPGQSIRKAVVLPLPDGPTRTTNSPSRAVIVRPWTTRCSPYRFETLSKITSAMIVIGLTPSPFSQCWKTGIRISSSVDHIRRRYSTQDPSQYPSTGLQFLWKESGRSPEASWLGWAAPTILMSLESHDPGSSPGLEQQMPDSRSTRGAVRAPEFPSNLQWFNTEQPLRLADLRGKLVILDLWTYC